MLLNRYNLMIASLAPKPGSRYALAAIHVGPEGTAVTNGEYLVAVTLPHVDKTNFPSIDGFTQQQTSEPFLLGGADAVKLEKAIPKSYIPVLNHVAVGKPGENMLNLATTDLDTTQVFKPRKVSGQFPNWKAVMHAPEVEPVVEIRLSAKYLVALAKQAVAFMGDSVSGSHSPITLRLFGATESVEMWARNGDTGQTFFAVMMPMALDGEKWKWPGDSEKQTPVTRGARHGAGCNETAAGDAGVERAEGEKGEGATDSHE